MSKVNYIHHQIAFFSKVYEDDRLTPYHISLYLALFQYWNINRFCPNFSTSRAELMQLSKVKSKSTYSKCLNDLSKWNYIVYSPSTNPFIKSSFDLSIRWTSDGSDISTSSSFNGPAIHQPSTKNGLVSVSEKTVKHKEVNIKREPPSEIQVINFFNSQKSNKVEGSKFWNYYQSIGWTIGKSKIKDWKAAARKWILSAKPANQNKLVHRMDHLHTTSNKKYNEPL